MSTTATPATVETLRRRAARFALDFAGATYEMGQAQNFIRGLCDVFDLPHLRAVSFEHKVKKVSGKSGRIDGFFPGLLLIEMKSAGADLAQAYTQACEYLPKLPAAELPRHVLVSDFAQLHLYDREQHSAPLCFALAELPQHIESLLFLAGYKTEIAQQQAALNTQAAESLAELHDAMKANGYSGHDLEMYLVRLVFCLFADDTALFGRNKIFQQFLLNHTRADGSDLHERLAALFEVLDQPLAKRMRNLPAYLAEFPYVNGALFEGKLATYYFSEEDRQRLLACAALDWSAISPEIFGSLFQAVMDHTQNLGAHYTSDRNIRKAIDPLFLGALRTELDALLNLTRGPARSKKLRDFQQRLSQIHIFDPACGCGNFLVVAYRELRALETEVIEALFGRADQHLDIDALVLCHVDQCHGIEIDPTAAQIATVALWLTDHQMNSALGLRLGDHYARLPLARRAHIVCGNALRLDWAEIVSPERCTVVVGNPPFIGSSLQSASQKEDMALVAGHLAGAGVLDYVAAWYIKAAAYIAKQPRIPVAFVSTNSICQGEQVAPLWTPLLAQGVQLHFAHRTFRWSNEGQGVAAVHCIIVGFGLMPCAEKRLFDYGDEVAGEPTEIAATQINPYLVDAPSILIGKRRQPLCQSVPNMIYGSKPTDGGHLLLTPQEAEEIRATDPIAAKYLRQFLGADEFINNLPRYCLWLTESTATDRKNSPQIQQRIQAVAAMRRASPKVPTQKLAASPYLFGEVRQIDKPYLVVPRHSSEKRQFVPLGYFESGVVCGDSNFMVPNVSLYHFGVMCSTFHNAWMRAVCGRLESRYRYSNTIVYNNFPWPDSPKPAARARVEQAAQQVLDARKAEEARCAALGQPCSLATLYDTDAMPKELAKAHAALDKAVDAAYGYKNPPDDARRVAFLFERYLALTTRTAV